MSLGLGLIRQFLYYDILRTTVSMLSICLRAWGLCILLCLTDKVVGFTRNTCSVTIDVRHRADLKIKSTFSERPISDRLDAVNAPNLLYKATKLGFSAFIASLSLQSYILPANALYRNEMEIPPFPAKGFQSKSGLKYFDLPSKVPVANKRTPRYGELVAFRYATMYRPYNGALRIVDTSDRGASAEGEPVLTKHGNNRMIKAVDEALHTMTMGSRRRIIVPANLGYVETGLGPFPLASGDRKTLGTIIDEVAADRGELIIDLSLELIAEDEGDQGYYDDKAVTLEEIQRSLESIKSDKEAFDKVREQQEDAKSRPLTGTVQVR